MIRKKNIIISFLILLSAVGIFILLGYLKPKVPMKAEKPMRSILIRPVEKKMIVPKVRGYAFVKSSAIVEIRSEVSGKVVYSSKYRKNGSIVKEGDIIFKIDPDDYQIARDYAAADLLFLKSEKERLERNIEDIEKMCLAMKSDFDLEKDNFKRIDSLFSKGVISLAEKDRASQSLSRRNKIYIEASNRLASSRFELQETIAKIKRADTTLRQAELNLKRCIIKSPLEGRVVNCNIDKGEYLNKGEILCVIKNDMKPELSVPLDVHNLSTILGIMPDKEKWFKVPKEMKVTVSWDENPKKCQWDSKIIRIEKYNLHTDSVTLLVKPEKYKGISNKDYPLLPGMFCTVDFYGIPRKGFSIPFSALQVGNKVYTVDDKGVLAAHKVEPFLIENDSLIILGGIPDKCRIVARQLPRGVISGMKINPVMEGNSKE